MVVAAVVVLLRRRTIAVAALLALIPPASGCTGLFFQPMRTEVRTPGDLGLAWRDVRFHAPDGVELHGWLLPADGVPRGTIVFLHGNAENISTHIGAVAWLPAQGFTVFLPDYRGYGRSHGVPEIEGLHEDAAAAVALALGLGEARLEGVDPAEVAVFGQSLGGSIAITTVAHAAWRERIRGLAVEGAFAGWRRIARDVLSRVWITWPLQWPLSLLVDDERSPVEDIARIAPTPLLVIQDGEDAIVDADHGRDLSTAAGAPAASWLVPNAGHVAAFADPEVRHRFAAWLSACAFGDGAQASICREAWTAPETSGAAAGGASGAAVRLRASRSGGT